MRSTILTALLITAAVPVAEAKVHSLRRGSKAYLARAEKYLAQGEQIVRHANKFKKESKRVRVLLASNRRFQRARAQVFTAMPHVDGACAKVQKPDRMVCHKLQSVERRATRALVDVLNEEAEFYFGRTSTGRAKKLNQEALALLPKDPRALALARDIRNAANTNGGVAVRSR